MNKEHKISIPTTQIKQAKPILAFFTYELFSLSLSFNASFVDVAVGVLDFVVLPVVVFSVAVVVVVVDGTVPSLINLSLSNVRHVETMGASESAGSYM